DLGHERLGGRSECGGDEHVDEVGQRAAFLVSHQATPTATSCRSARPAPSGVSSSTVRAATVVVMRSGAATTAPKSSQRRISFWPGSASPIGAATVEYALPRSRAARATGPARSTADSRPMKLWP